MVTMVMGIVHFIVVCLVVSSILHNYPTFEPLIAIILLCNLNMIDIYIPGILVWVNFLQMSRNGRMGGGSFIQ